MEFSNRFRLGERLGVVNKEGDWLVPVFSLVLSLCRVHGRERPVWSCGVVEWFGRLPNEQPVAWSDSWSHTWREGGAICTLLLNLGSEQHPTPQKVIWLGGSRFGRPSREGQARSYGAILKLIFQGRYALPKGYVSRLRCSFEVNL